MIDYSKHADVLKLVGRIFISVIFIVSGYGKIVGFAGTAGFMASMGVPFSELALVIAIILELGGGLLLLVGYKTRIAACGLILFTVLATLFFHLDFSDQTQIIAFNKNLAIVGGLLYVLIGGAGKYKLGKGD